MRLSSAMATTYSGASKTVIASEGVGELGGRVSQGQRRRFYLSGGAGDGRHVARAPWMPATAPLLL